MKILVMGLPGSGKTYLNSEVSAIVRMLHGTTLIK